MTLTDINIRFLYLICGAKYGGFSSVQVYPKSCYIHEKQSGTVFTHTA